MATAMAKPGRSEDNQLDAEQQARLADDIRLKLESIAPKRPLKPSRSDDFDSGLSAADLPPFEGPIPEHIKLQQLLQTTPPQIINQEYAGEPPQEFVETEYYKDLRAADQTLHHTTGTGFIQMPSNGVVDLGSLPSAPVERTEVTFSGEIPEEFVETEYYNDLNAIDRSLHHTTGTGFIQVEKNGEFKLDCSSSSLARTKSGCNPATNDWIPAEAVVESAVSLKPPRSEA